LETGQEVEDGKNQVAQVVVLDGALYHRADILRGLIELTHETKKKKKNKG
jgi:hypothetical protein